MAVKSKREPKSTTRQVSAPATVYLGCFDFAEPGHQSHEGSFQIVVAAPDANRALDRCRQRVRFLRDNSTLFTSPTTIYLRGLLELSGSLRKGLLVNFESRPQPDEDVSWQLLNMVPEQEHDETNVYDIDPGEDGEHLFLDFGGKKMAEALALARDGARGRPDESTVTAPPSLSPAELAERTRSTVAAERRGEKEARTRGKKRDALVKAVEAVRSRNKAKEPGRRSPG